MAHRWHIILTVGALLALVFTLSLGAIDDFDVWWHLACGEKIIRDGWIPRQEIFSYTAAGRPWVDGYIPAEVLMRVVWGLWGSAGIVLLGAVFMTGTFALALWISRSGPGFKVAILTFFPAIFLARGFILPRPALLTCPFVLLTLWLLEDYRRVGGRRVLWLLPLTSLWANCHPAFIMGLMLSGIYVCGQTISAFMTGGMKLDRLVSATKNWMALFSGQVIATLVNPYGFRIYFSLYKSLTEPRFKSGNLEMMPLFQGGEVSGTIPALIVIVALGLVCFLWSGRRSRPEHIIAFFFFFIFGVMWRRFALTFSFLSIPLIAWAVTGGAEAGGFSEAARRFAQMVERALIPLVSIAALFFIWFAATDRLYFYTNHLRCTSLGINPFFYPQGAVELLNKEQVQGNIFHNFDLGGYLNFHLYPRYRIYDDGRNFVYPLDVSVKGDDALRSEDVFNQVKSKYDIRAVLLPFYHYGAWPMIIALIRSPNWAVVHADGAAILFLERGVGNDDIIQRHEMNLLLNPPAIPSHPPDRAYGFFSRAELPVGQMWWAMLYSRMGRFDLAARALQPALNYRPVKKEMEAWLKDLMNKSAQGGG